MSHYPSTQELAAFRVAIADDHWTAPHVLDWRGHAFPSELRDGIGYRDGHSSVTVDTIAGPMRDDPPAKYARWCASAMRSRAYAHAGMASQWLVPVHPRSGGAWYAERVDGAPYQWHTLANLDIVSTDTWTEEEPRHPLPIRYQPSWVLVP